LPTIIAAIVFESLLKFKHAKGKKSL